MASMTLSGSVVPAFSTAFTHMLKPIIVGLHRVVGDALVVLDEGLARTSMNSALAGSSTLMK
jgi:hypothetical protein